MDYSNLALAGVAGVVGLMLGLAVAPRGADTDELAYALSGQFEQIRAEVQEVDEVAQEVGAGILALDERLGALEAATAASGVALISTVEQLDARLTDRIAALDQTLEARAQESQAATAAALEILVAAALSGSSPSSQKQSTDEDHEPMAAPPAQPDGGQDQTTAAAGQTDPAPIQEMDPDIVAAMLYSTGGTLLLSDGAVRAYISRVDPETQIVTLFVNGEVSSLMPGQSVAAEVNGQICRVSLMGIRDRSAALDATCEPAS